MDVEMPPKTKYPTPSLRFHNGAWKVLWSWQGKQYSVSTGLSEIDKLFAEQRRIEIAIALKKDTPAFPEEYARAKSVLKYVEARYGVEHADQSVGSNPEQWIGEYVHELRGKNTKGWIRDSKTMLEKLQAAAKGLDSVTSKFATAYMADIAAKPPKKRSEKNEGRGSPGTHNRTLTVFKKFYDWLATTERHASANPFAAIKRLKERKDTPIVYCTSAERDEMIEMAKATGWPEWPAVFIAFHTGMRREEVANLLWNDVKFDTGAINVTKSKTGLPRTFPLPTIVENFLKDIPGRSGHVVNVAKGRRRIGRLNSLMNRIKKDKTAALLKQWKIEKPKPSRSSIFKEKWGEFEAAVMERKGELESELEHIGWNVCRHTFASLKVQDGVDVQKVARWIGDTLETCLLHYAQFIPKDRRDPDIDRG